MVASVGYIQWLMVVAAVDSEAAAVHSGAHTRRRLVAASGAPAAAAAVGRDAKPGERWSAARLASPRTHPWLGPIPSPHQSLSLAPLRLGGHVPAAGPSSGLRTTLPFAVAGVARALLPRDSTGRAIRASSLGVRRTWIACVKMVSCRQKRASEPQALSVSYTRPNSRLAPL